MFRSLAPITLECISTLLYILIFILSNKYMKYITALTSIYSPIRWLFWCKGAFTLFWSKIYFILKNTKLQLRHFMVLKLKMTKKNME